MKTSTSLLILLSLIFFNYTIVQANNTIIEPSAAFGARVIYGQNVIVGSPSGEDPNIYDYFPIKEGTSDRTCLEFDLAGQSTTSGDLYLNFYMRNLDDPSYSTLSLYSYDGDGVATASDYFKTDNFITNFSDYGEYLPYVKPFSLNVTDIYNQYISSGKDYLGFNLKANDTQARYDLHPGGFGYDRGVPIMLHCNPLPSIGMAEEFLTAYLSYQTDLIRLGDTLNFEYWLEMGIDPPDYQPNLMLDVLAVQGGEGWRFIGQVGGYEDSADWKIVSLIVPEELRGKEAQIRFVLSDYDPNTNPTAYLRNLPNPTPEPTTMLLFGAGLVGLAAFGRKKFKK